MSSLPSRFLTLVAASALLLSANASATWSVAAVHPESGTIAVAGASCSYMVYGIARVLPGQGVVIVQAASNEKARSDAAEWLGKGDSFDAIMARLTAKDADYAIAQQQLALLRVDGKELPRTFTGDEVEGFKGSKVAHGVSVQANTMATDRVVPSTFAALHPADWADDQAMADAMIRALAAGAAEGGDKRCTGTGSATAFISLFRKNDNERVPWLNLVVYGIEPGSLDAVAQLQTLYRDWRKTKPSPASLQVFKIPAATKTNKKSDADGR
jgi:uncharacterized Ntn-hydrolase superfamily protein